MKSKLIIGTLAGLCCMTATLIGARADGLVDPSRAAISTPSRARR